MQKMFFGSLLRLLCFLVVTLFLAPLFASCFAACPDADNPAQARTAKDESDVDTLLERLGSEDRDARLQALSDLYDLGARAQSAVPTLIETFDDEDDLVASRAVGVVVKVGPAAIPALIESLYHPATRVRIKSARALGEMRSKASKAVGPLVKVAKNRHNCSDLRIEAIEALDNIKDENAIPDLTDIVISNSDEKIRQRAAEALARNGKKAKSAMPALVGILKNYKLDGVRNDVMDGVDFALAELGGDAAPAIVEIADNEQNQLVIRRRAVGVLHSMVTYRKASEMDDVVEVLARISLNGRLDAELREEAIRVLGLMKDYAANACPYLEKVLSDGDPSIRYEAADAISLIDPKNPKIMATFLKALEDKDILTRMKAADGLGRCRSDPKQVVRHLRKMLAEDCVLLRRSAAYSLGVMGSSARAALPDLRNAIEDDGIGDAVKQAIEEIERK